MRRGRFTEDQIIGVLREHEAGVKTAELCRKHGISDATFYNWKAKYGGMTVSEAARLRTLEDENRRLKKLLAESMLDVSALEGSVGKKLTRSVDRYAAVEKLMADHGFSERRACRLIGVNRSAWQYEPLRGRTMLCASECARSRTSVVGSAIAGWRSCSGVKARA